MSAGPQPRVPLPEIARQWGRIGTVGFGGPPAHVSLLRELCVDRRRWIDTRQFEDAIAATNLLPGPASTQLAIFCAWRLRGALGAAIGGLCFIGPGLVLILALAALFLTGTPPSWLRGAGAGAGAAVAVVAVDAGARLILPTWRRVGARQRPRVVFYAALGAIAAAALGPWLVLVLLGCGAAEVVGRRAAPRRLRSLHPGALLLAAGTAASAGGLGALSWTALKVGALSYGGGFVIVPLMQADAVRNGWMTDGEFLNAVALGQVTPGPVTHTVAVVGYAAAALPGGLLAAALAFAPSFAFVLIGADRFDRLIADRTVRAFLDGAGPAAVGAIIGSAVPLARALQEPWQWAVLAGAAALMLLVRRGVVLTLLAAGAAGVAVALLGGPLPI